MKAFTLIELLVVVSIIGLLASIVLVSLEGAEDQARITVGKQFSGSLKNALGADLVGEWTFDNDTTEDTSGWNNNGFINGGVTFDDGVIGRAARFNGSTGYIEIDDSNSLDITDEITIELWVKFIGAAPSPYDNVINKDTWWGPWSIILESNLRVKFSLSPDYSGARRGDGNKTIEAEKWHHIVLTGDTSYMEGFIDGELVLSMDQDISSIGTTDTPLYIGRQGTGGYYFEGYIDEVRIYNKSLSSAEIQQFYTQEN
ncbi:MAG: LamG-like jellyroll fold domain-containing protein [bacterium]